MIETWRWFGPSDPVNLREIRQAGATGIVTSLHDIPAGDVWSEAAIAQRKDLLAEHGFNWAVVESVPVHNEIKAGGPMAERLLVNYCETLRNLGAQGVGVVCYNFMAVVDWTRTNLRFSTANSSLTLRFDITEFAAYDIYILRRPGAADDYTAEVCDTAAELARHMGEAEQHALEQNIIAGLPGGYGSYSRSEILSAIERFRALGDDGLRTNLYAFLDRVLPVAEAAGVRLCIHPDDPPFSLFGLPRVMSTAKDARDLLERFPGVANGLTLCAGSFGARGDNDL
ncbi:MAG: mannonate dehydratase, partial [Pseudomonadales bacterium]